MTLTSFLSSIGHHRWIWPSALLVLLAGAALFAPWIAPQDPYDLASLRLEDSYLPPPWSDEAEDAPDGSLSDRFFLGTDAQGRGIYSAVLYGLRVSLIVGISGTLIALYAPPTDRPTKGLIVYLGGMGGIIGPERKMVEHQK